MEKKEVWTVEYRIEAETAEGTIMATQSMDVCESERMARLREDFNTRNYWEKGYEPITMINAPTLLTKIYKKEGCPTYGIKVARRTLVSSWPSAAYCRGEYDY